MYYTEIIQKVVAFNALLHTYTLLFRGHIWKSILGTST